MIFGLLRGLLLPCVCVIGCGNGPGSETGKQTGRHAAEVLPSTASHSLLYRPPGGRDPTITLSKLERERSELTGLESTNVPHLPCDPRASLFHEMCGPHQEIPGGNERWLVVVKQSRLLGGTLAASLGQGVQGD